MAVFDAFFRAKTLAYQTKDRLSWATDMLPWYSQELENTRALMGQNFYPYGIAQNRPSLEAIFDSSHQQGFMSDPLKISDVFLPGSLDFTE